MTNRTAESTHERPVPAHCRSCVPPEEAAALLPARANPTEPEDGIAYRSDCEHESLCLSVAFGWVALSCGKCPLARDPIAVPCERPTQAAVRRRRKAARDPSAPSITRRDDGRITHGERIVAWLTERGGEASTAEGIEAMKPWMARSTANTIVGVLRDDGILQRGCYGVWRLAEKVRSTRLGASDPASP